jgi:hypothetical protein
MSFKENRPDNLITYSSIDGRGNWVLVYGYTNREQYLALLKTFSSYGTVLQQKGNNTWFDVHGKSIHSNWLALQYESRLQAEKALCHNHFQIEPGIFCGVNLLEENDPILLLQSDSKPRQHDDQQVRGNDDNESTLVCSGIVGSIERSQSPCERFFRWLLSIE